MVVQYFFQEPAGARNCDKVDNTQGRDSPSPCNSLMCSSSILSCPISAKLEEKILLAYGKFLFF